MTGNGCTGNLCLLIARFINTLYQYIFSFHIQTDYILSLLERQRENLLSKSKSTNPLGFLLTSVEYKEKMIPIQQLLELEERFFAYSLFGRIFSQFQYVFSHNQSSSHHNFVKYIVIINIFGGFK